MSDDEQALTAGDPATVWPSSAKAAGRTVRARIDDGARCLQAIGGPDHDGPLKKVAEVSPDMADLLLAFPYGDVMSRPGLSLRHRQICTVAMLLAHRSAQAQLRFHMRGLLNVGGSIDELVELLVIASGLLGFPPAIAGVPIVRDLIAEAGVAYVPAEHQPASAEERFERGAQAIRALLHVEPEAYAAAFVEISPALAQWTVAFEFGEVLARSGLDAVAKHLASLMMLAMRGNSEDRLLLHLRGALAADVPRTAIVEALIQLSVYGGFPTALTAFGIAAEAFAGPGAPRHDAPPSGAIMRTEPFDRAARGLATLNATSADAGDAVVKSFAGVAPDIGTMIVDHAYGDIFAGPGSIPRRANWLPARRSRRWARSTRGRSASTSRPPGRSGRPRPRSSRPSSILRPMPATRRFSGLSSWRTTRCAQPVKTERNASCRTSP